MTISYYPEKPEKCIITGLSSDTKPTAPQPEWIYLETDTGHLYLVVGGQWVQTPIPRSYQSIELAFNTARTPSETQDVEVIASIKQNIPYQKDGLIEVQIDNSGGGTFTTVGSAEFFTEDNNQDPNQITHITRLITFIVPRTSQYRIVASGEDVTNEIISIYELTL